jgi:predicted nucleic acid-binding protein
MVGDPVFLDTNVLIYASRPASPVHQAARARMAAFDDAGCPLWVSPQVLREYLAVVTRPQGATPPLRAAEALRDISGFQERFEIAPETPAVFARLLTLLAAFPIGGRQVHDANLVASMLENGIYRLLTFNIRDFQRFSGMIEIVAN